ncbi:unnamed protein product, partial [Prorocentrum cordatum]
AQSKTKSVEKCLEKELAKLERWRAGVLALESAIQEMSDEMDALEKNYSELMSQISFEVQPPAPKMDPVPKGPPISLRALIEAEEDKEQLETRKKLLQNGLKDMAKNLFGAASEHLQAAREEHKDHLTRMSKKKRKNED